MLCDLLLSAATARAWVADKRCYDCSCFGSERYEMCSWGLGKSITGSSELVTRTNHHLLSWRFVLLLLHWECRASGRATAASAGSSPCCTSSIDVTSMLCRCKEQELSKARITKATFIPLLPLMRSQVSSSIVTVGPIFTCKKAPAPIHFKFCGGSSQKIKRPLRKAMRDAPALGCHLHLIST